MSRSLPTMTSMAKRVRSPSPVVGGAAGINPANKRPRTSEARAVHRKIATAATAAAVDADPPFKILEKAVVNAFTTPEKGKAVVYWMRMEDLRIHDNRAISQASATAQKHGIPLVVLFVLTPDEYHVHDRSSRRIDFALRNLAEIKESLAELNIPLKIISHSPRLTVPSRVLAFMGELSSKHLFANMEYEVDELRRDIQMCAITKNAGIRTVFVHDKLLIAPGVLATKQGKPYAVYTPFQRSWLAHLNSNLDLLEEAPLPEPNSIQVRDDPRMMDMFTSQVPVSVEGFECVDRDVMKEVWPAGTTAALQVLGRFVKTKSRAIQLGVVSPLTQGAEESSRHSRLQAYADGRNRADRDSSSRLSPYLASGVISARECVRQTMQVADRKTVEGGRDTGIGIWVQELAWRDFYTHVLTSFPRVSMGRPYQEKMANVKWEVNDDHLQAWKDGKTGVPIVDAAMRQCLKMGWMHNRVRMIAAMYLTKDLMIDWRLGEKHFMEQFIDGDLASNNGGWQWSASTGTDAQPYFRIFNPASQSQKADPTGDYIRTFVPELAKLRGPDIHAPPPSVADKLGYPRPLVDHAEARKRALARYKNPGEG